MIMCILSLTFWSIQNGTLNELTQGKLQIPLSITSVPPGMTIPAFSGSFPTLQNLSATVVVKRTHPDIALCNSYICNMLLDLCVKNDQLRMFRILLENWPHEEARLNLKPATLHYLQSLAILENKPYANGFLYSDA